MTSITVRSLRDGETPPGLTSWSTPAGGTTLVAERAETIIACGVMDPAGSATVDDAPSIRLIFAELDAEPERDLRILVQALVEAAAGTDASRVTIGWDPMDHAGLKMLGGVGFAPTGNMPYFELGPGHVEYVSGYQDASGSVLDLVRSLRGHRGETAVEPG